MTTNFNYMKRIVRASFAAAFLLMLAACGSSSKDSNATLNDKKAQLEKLKEEQKKLEADINKMDTAAAKAEKPKLVTIEAVAPSDFTHFIDLQGKVESQNISYIAPRNGTGGVVKQVLVKRGDRVRKGQLLLKLDDAIARQNLVTARQGIENIKTQLSYAQDLYQRQKNLWDQKIGTEVQLINAKNNVQNIENQLKSAQESLKLTQEQLSFTNVVSDVDGVAEIVNIRVGEVFTGVQGTTPQISIVNNSNLKATVNVPENYLGKVNVGSKVKVTLPDLNKTIDATVTVTGKSIDPVNRSFFVEAKLPQSADLRPNQIAMVRIQDYNINNSITVPVNTVQSDEKGKFVMTAVKENGKTIARKKTVVIGQFYGDKMEIKSGLQPGDLVVTDGYQSLYEGQLLTTDAK
ncbi:MAG TPA: efflux RND transporter periplasmic adaptor subunit [Chitinophagaceae bacterium]|nr:efflux RND transporter periplasmic adaptor subunit [Chitinophagaceae bacterium]